MNLLFSSILIFILIAPGLIFRFSYLQGSYSKLNFRPSAVDEIFWALIPALFFQLAAVLFVEFFFAIKIRVDIFYSLINGDSSGSIDFKALESGFFLFLVYTLSLIFISAVMGRLFRSIIRKYKLDIRYRFFRLNNEWHYLFSGEILDFPYISNESENIEIIQIDMLANIGEGTMIYSGILEDYYLSKDNGLDRLYLSHVYRRKLKDDLAYPDQSGVQKLDERYYQMPGELFVIQYDKIVNMNVTYHRFSLDEAETNESESE